MRTLVSLLCCLFLSACSRPGGVETLVLQLPSGATEEERAFASALKLAFQQKDPALFVRLSHWKASEGQPPFHLDFYTALIARGCRAIKLERVDPALATERVENESKVRESLPVRWSVVIEHPTDYDSHTDMYAGLDDESIKLTTSYVVKEEPNQPPQRNAGSRPSSGDLSTSETPSSLGPRG